MKRKSFLLLLLVCLILPSAFLMSGCKKDPPPPPQNVELTEFRNIAISVIQYFKNSEVVAAPASALRKDDNSYIIKLNSSSDLEHISRLQQTVKDYPYKEKVASVEQYRKTMYEQLFYLPIACGELLHEEFGVTDFYGSKIKFFDDTTVDEDGTSHRLDTYFYIDKVDGQIIITIYEEFFENEVLAHTTYNYATLNYINDSKFDARLVTYSNNLSYLSYMYLDSENNFVEVKYDTNADPQNNIIEHFETLSSDGADSYILSDKQTTTTCKDILVEMDNPTQHTELIVAPKNSFMYELHIDKILAKIDAFVREMEDFEVPAPLFTVQNGILIDINHRDYSEQEVITIPANVTALNYQQLTLSSNVKKVIIPSSVEKLVIEKEVFNHWADWKDIKVNLPLIDNKYYELSYEYLDDSGLDLFKIYDANEPDSMKKFDMNTIVISEESKLFSKDEKENLYLKVRTIDAIINDGAPIDYLIKIKDYATYFGDNYVLNVVNKPLESGSERLAKIMFPDTEPKLANELLAHAIKYAKTIVVTVVDPLYSTLNEICELTLVEHYGLNDNLNLSDYDTCIFKVENFIITDNLSPNFRANAHTTTFGFAINYFKEIKNLTIKSNYVKNYSLQSTLAESNSELQTHKFESIVIEENITGITFELFELQTNNISFHSTMTTIDFMQCKLTCNNDLHLPITERLNLPGSYGMSNPNVALYVNGDLTIDSTNCNSYIHLGNIVTTGDIVFTVGKNVVNFYYNDITANSTTLKLDFSRKQFEKMNNEPYSLKETLERILNEENSIFKVEFKYSFEVEVSNKFIYNESTEDYSYNARHNIENLDFKNYITAEDATIKANTVNNFESAQGSIVNLNVGNNTFYVFAKDNLSTELKVFKVNIYRNRMFKFIIDPQGGEFNANIETERDIEENIKNYFEFPEHQPLPEKYGYNFYTWYIQPELPADHPYEPSTSLTVSGAFEHDDIEHKYYINPTANVVVYAIYEIANYYITYVNENNEYSQYRYTFTSEVVRSYTIFDEDFELPTNMVFPFDPDNYQFEGWFTDESLSEEFSISKIQTATAQEYVLYAKVGLIPRSVVYKYLFMFESEEYDFPSEVAAQNPSTIVCGFTDSANSLNFLKKVNGGDLSYPSIPAGEFDSWACRYDETIKRYTVIARYDAKTFSILTVGVCTTEGCTRCAEIDELPICSLTFFNFRSEAVNIQINFSGSYHNAEVYVDAEMTTRLLDVLNFPNGYWSFNASEYITFKAKKYYEDNQTASDIYLYYKLTEIE